MPHSAAWLKRLALRRGYDDAALEKWMARQDPRAVEDRRQAERRTEGLSGPDLDRRLRELGISSDRRQGPRRQPIDRRRGR